MDSIISPSQAVFIHGRYILDAPVIINEVIHSAKKDRNGCFLFKVDFEKAYDSMDWTFLDYMLSRFGFSLRWRKWINACLSSTTMAILVNGSPMAQFSVSRGIRQGDPMAPFLFLMVAEGFAGLVRKARSIGAFEGLKIGRGGVEVCDLQFADDTIIVCNPSHKNLFCLKTILRCFELASGLKVNSNKSSLYEMRLSDSSIAAAADFLFCKVGSIPFLYLGIPVGANPRRLSTWQAPKKVLDKIASLQRRFLWGNNRGGKGIAWVAWDVVCKSKELGGLGVKDLFRFNLALLGKWRWRRLQDKDALWVKVINSKYGLEWLSHPNICSSRWWRDLGKVGSSGEDSGGWFVDNVWKDIGNGLQTLFWHDIWVGNQSLKVAFPRLFNLASNHGAWVGDNGYWKDDVWYWEIPWKRDMSAEMYL
ncbi:PREDICTED: uncharacterized protein LOC109329295 [Lupinus angustifolius]|uniref:uncharacterized protein LOC109329295 n=1 Tax=Lupinus angustifolius TaxID=3871 RepID=UPI00092F3947|nr:PREDICTED: uncharacterized protein LOC109329295 [Lupinus angustifolius]